MFISIGKCAELGLTTLLAAGAFSSEAVLPAPPADAVLRSEVESLVKDLGAREYKKRESAARRLVEIGEGAVWALVQGAQGADPEVRLRSAEILQEIAWVPPETQVEINRLVEELKKTRDPDEAKRLYQIVGRMGSAGIKGLRALFARGTPSETDFEITAAFERRTVVLTGAASCVVTLRNKGAEGVWINPDGLRCQWKLFEEDGVNLRERRKPPFALRDNAKKRADVLYLAPGQAYQRTFTLAEGLSVAGPYGAVPSYLCQESARPQRGAGDLPASIQSDLPALEASPLALSGDAVRFYALPDLSVAPSGPAACEVVCDAGEFAPGGLVSFVWSLKGELPLLPESEERQGKLTERYWAALVDAKGETAAMVFLKPEGVSQGAADTTSTTISGRGVLSAPAASGTYRLFVGLSRLAKGALTESRQDIVSNPVSVVVR